jgi:hypothetical protein
MHFERTKPTIPIKPESFALDKGIIGEITKGRAPPLDETVRRLRNDRPEVPPEAAIVYSIAGQLPKGCEISREEEAVPNEGVQIDQVGITGKGGETLVGRVSVTCGPEGAYLPFSETGGYLKIDEAAS